MAGWSDSQDDDCEEGETLAPVAPEQVFLRLPSSRPPFCFPVIPLPDLIEARAEAAPVRSFDYLCLPDGGCVCGFDVGDPFDCVVHLDPFECASSDDSDGNASDPHQSSERHVSDGQSGAVGELAGQTDDVQIHKPNEGKEPHVDDRKSYESEESDQSLERQMSEAEERQQADDVQVGRPDQNEESLIDDHQVHESEESDPSPERQLSEAEQLQ
jgi:hypothetical protein